ncbi:MAG: hypothetical protein E7160_03710 [Firmicutes bacterium]|nr:hypothetical protein [Bacillota bacterium]
MAFFNNDNNKNKKFITSKEYRLCSKCGASMEANKRYCIKCGALNYEHPDNQYMKKYVSKNEVNKINRDYYNNIQEDFSAYSSDDVYVGGQKLKEVKVEDKNEDEVVKNINYTKGFGYLILFHLVLFGVVYYFVKMNLNTSLFISIFCFISMAYFVATCNLYRKANYSGFTPFIPIYNYLVYLDIVLESNFYWFLILIPGVNVVFLIYLLYKTGECFGINGFLTIIGWPVILLYIGYSNNVGFYGRANSKPANNKIVTIIGASIFVFIIIVLLGCKLLCS